MNASRLTATPLRRAASNHPAPPSRRGSCRPWWRRACLALAPALLAPALAVGASLCDTAPGPELWEAALAFGRPAPVPIVHTDWDNIRYHGMLFRGKNVEVFLRDADVATLTLPVALELVDRSDYAYEQFVELIGTRPTPHRPRLAFVLRGTAGGSCFRCDLQFNPHAASTFALSDFLDLPLLASRLMQPDRPVDAWLLAELSPATRALLARYQGTAADQAELATALRAEINVLITHGPIYEPGRFAGIDLRLETQDLQDLVSRNPNSETPHLVNRLLFEDAYPRELSRNHHGFLAAGAAATLPFVVHEMAHHFDFYGVHLFTGIDIGHTWTSFIDFYIYVASRSGVDATYPRHLDPDRFLQFMVDTFFNPYLRSAEANWSDCVLEAGCHLPMGLNQDEQQRAIQGGMLLRIAQLHGVGAIKQALRHLGQIVEERSLDPFQISPPEKADLLFEVFSHGAKTNMAGYADAWRWPISPALRAALERPYGPNPLAVDDDGDGYSEAAGDTDDANPAIHPGQGEVANGVDDDSNGVVDDLVTLEQGDFPDAGAEPQPIGVPGRIRGAIGPSDTDSFVFELAAPSRLSISLFPLGSFWVDVSVDGEGLLTSEKWPEEESLLLAAGPHRLDVNAQFSDSDGTYEIVLQPGEPWPVHVAPPPPERRPNGNWQLTSAPVPQALAGDGAVVARFWVYGHGWVGVSPVDPDGHARFEWVPGCCEAYDGLSFRCQFYRGEDPAYALSESVPFLSGDEVPELELSVDPPSLEWGAVTTAVLTANLHSSAVNYRRVRFYRGTEELGAVPAEGNATLSYTWVNPPAGLLCLTAVAETVAGQYATSSPIAVVSMPAWHLADTNLEAAIRQRLGRTTGALTPLDALRLRDLRGWSSQIGSLSGLEAAVHLRELHLFENQVTDLAPLSTLKELKVLDLRYNGVADLGPLTAANGLEEVYLEGNRVPDLSPLAGARGLRHLALHRNQVRDLTPLTGHPNLAYLDLRYNPVDDLAPLLTVPRLSRLLLEDQSTLDLATIAKLKQLRALDLPVCNLSDLTFLKPLTQLEALDLRNNQIRDLSPLSGLTRLTELRLDSNPIEQPVLQCWLQSPDQFALRVLGPSGWTYAIEATDELRPPDTVWHRVVEGTLSTALGPVIVQAVKQADHRIFSASHE